MECCCQNHYGDLGQGLLDTFAAVRERCPALNRILVPDDLWPTFQEWDRQLPDDDLHRSILLLAMERGHLGRVTAGIHRYLIEAGAPRANLGQQYLQDLQERWIKYRDPLERNRKSRAFLGRLVELQCAEWLESQGWTILGLEALGEKSDIVARNDAGTVTAFEVKFVGREDEDFVLMLNSLSGKPAGRWASPYTPANYLLFRAYAAAKQLQRTGTGRIALLVILDATWGRFRLPLDWINWRNPKFFDDGDRTWQKFLEDKRKRQLDSDLQTALRDLDAIWIFKHSYGFQYAREFKFHTRPSA